MIETFFWLSVIGILYTYFGYPAFLALLARIRPESAWVGQSEALHSSGFGQSEALHSSGVGQIGALHSFLTLLVPAYNEAALMARKLENCLELDYPRECLQILVVSDGSDDGTPDIVRGFAARGVELCHKDVRQGKMAAISGAMPKVRGEIVVISDATNFFESDALRELAAPFADPSVGLVTGAKSIVQGDGALGKSEGAYWKYESFILRQENRLGCCVAATGDSMAFRRDLFDPAVVGAFTEDFHMAMGIIRRGYRVVYAPNVPSYERVAPSAAHEKERRARIIAGRWQAIFSAHRLLPLNRPLLLWQVVSHKFMRPLVPFMMMAALLTNLIIIIGAGHLFVYDILFWLQILFYAMAWVGRYMEHRDGFGKLFYLPTFLVNSNMAALAGLYRFLTKRQTTLWTRVPRRDEEEG